MSGIPFGLDSEQAPLWADGQNVLFQRGGVMKSRGYAAAFSAPDSNPIQGFTQTALSGVLTMYFGDTEKIWEYNGSLTEIGSGYSGNADETSVAKASHWSMVDWGEWLFATNGIDAPQVYKGSACADMEGGAPATAEIFIKKKNFLLAFNTDLGENWFEWCDLDDPDDWVPTETNAAGNLPIRELSGFIAAEHLGEHIAVYDKDVMAICSYIGAPLYWNGRLALEGIGAVGKKAVCAEGRRNWGFSTKGLWVTDGSTYEYIDEPEMKEYLQDNFNWNQKSKTVVFHDEVNTAIGISYPKVGGSGDNSETILYNYKNKSWTRKSYGISAYSSQDDFQYPILGLPDGAVVFGENTYNLDGEAMSAYVTTKPLDMDRDDLYKFIDEIKIKLKEFSGTISVEIGGHDDLDDAIDWETAFTLDDGKEPIYPSINEYVHYYLKISSTAVSASWHLTGLQVLGEYSGEYS